MTESSEEFIYQESGEISIGEREGWAQKIVSAFPAFQSRNYQLYFGGQLVSLIGTWLQIVAEGWLVLQLTNSPFLIGLVTALATLPSLFFSLLGGVIVDRFPKKTILLFTQFSAMILALIYGLLTVSHLITIYEIALLAFLLGTVNAIDIPARQAFVVDLVGKESIASAVALNSGVFNAARVVGPSVAGLLIAWIGSGGAFILNGVSYIAALVALYLMHVQSTVSEVHANPLIAIKEGVTYAFSHPVIRILLLFTGVVSIFGWSYSTLMPIIAKNTFGLDAAGLGYLYAATGLGALIASIIVSTLSKKISSATFIFGGSILFCVGLFSFTLIHQMIPALLLLFLTGIGLLTQFATINTTLQHMVDDSVRGRVMSLYALMFLGFSPFGNFEIGYVAEKFSTAFAIQVGCIIIFLFTAYIFTQRETIRKAYKDYIAS